MISGPQGNSVNPVVLAEITDPTGVANSGYIYTNDVSGRTELMYKDDTGAEIQMTSAGQINSPAGAPGAAPVGAQYLVLTADATLTVERVFTPGTGLSAVDSGAGAAYTLSIDSTVVTLTGSQVLTNKTLTTPTIGDFSNAAHTHQNAAGGGQLDHGLALTGLTDDDHTIYALLAGRAGGQILIGGTAAGDDLTFRATSNATNGDIIFQTDPTTEVMRLNSSSQLIAGDNASAGAISEITFRTSSTINMTLRGETVSGFVGLTITDGNSDSLQISHNQGLGQIAFIDYIGFAGGSPFSNIRFRTRNDADNAQIENLRLIGGVNGATGGGIMNVDGLSTGDWIIRGDATDIFTADASTERAGIGISAPTAKFHIVHEAIATGTPNVLTVAGGAHTNLTASTEVVNVNVNLAQTVQWATGALTTQRAMLVQAPTYAFVGASTITSAATFAISGAPVAGTNATITNAYALWVQAGISQFDGRIDTASTVRTAAGSAGAPAYSFTGDTDTGFYRVSAKILGISADGVGRISVSTTSLSPISDNAMDLGTSLLRFNELFVASAGGIRLLAAAGDANPVVLIDSTIDLGAGGGTAVDVSLSRGAADRLDLASGDSFNIVSGHLLVGGATAETGSTNTVAILNGTAPDAGVADEVISYSSDDAAGHTIPSFFCEGTNVLATGQADSASSVRVKMRINGTVVTLLAI